MKNSPSFFLPLALAFFILPLAVLADGMATNNKSSTGVGNILSVFTMPTNPTQGRDPFYPESVRTLDTTPSALHTVEITSLKIPGISGTPGHLFAIINNHTFAVGDEGDVLTPNGRISLRCLEIQPDHVLVEISGQVHRINLEP